MISKNTKTSRLLLDFNKIKEQDENSQLMWALEKYGYDRVIKSLKKI